MINLIKPPTPGTRVVIANSEGERAEWVVLYAERKEGRYTGRLRVEYQGWLTASVLESDIEPEGTIMTLCDFQHADKRCPREATRIGILDADGREVKVGVCEHHSYRWGALWGSWPIPELEAEEEHEDDECPNCGGTVSVNGERYMGESPHTLICEGCELVYA